MKIVNWNFSFMDETVHIHVSTFSATPMNVFSNYILNKYATIDDKDSS